jgi:hypothetical protein
MGGVSPETCWASYKYEIIILVHCCILLDFSLWIILWCTDPRTSRFLTRTLGEVSLSYLWQLSCVVCWQQCRETAKEGERGWPDSPHCFVLWQHWILSSRYGYFILRTYLFSTQISIAVELNVCFPMRLPIVLRGTMTNLSRAVQFMYGRFVTAPRVLTRVRMGAHL